MNIKTRNIEAVIFDLDDTLIDWSTAEGSWEEVNHPRLVRVYELLKEAGHDLPEQDHFTTELRNSLNGIWQSAWGNWIVPSFGQAILNFLDGIGVDTAKVDVEELMAIYDLGPFPGVRPFDDTLPLLTELRDRSYKIGLITNSLFPISMRETELREYQITPFLDVRIASGDVGVIKPHPEIYNVVLERLGIDAESAVFVGDWPEFDIAGANAVGMTSVLITPPHLNRELNGVVPDHTISKLCDLLPILDRLES